jgi:hypothetical protein
MSEEKPQEDFLEVDTPIPGQNFACISFVSPEKELAKKETFNLHRFLQENSKKYGLDADDIVTQYDDYVYQNRKTLEKEFFEANDFKTTVRGVKIRGVYDTYREAEVRAKLLQRKDTSFHVFVGQVGYWLPWDPCADDVEDQEYSENHLNKLVKKYKDNQKKKEEYFEQQKEDSVKRMNQANQEQRDRLQAEREAEEKEVPDQDLDNQDNNINDTDEKPNESTESAENTSGSTDNLTSLDLKNVTSKEVQKMIQDSLEQEDPWMKRKTEGNQSESESVLDLDK